MKWSFGISNFLKRTLVFPILLFSSISLHCSLTKSFLSLPSRANDLLELSILSMVAQMVKYLTTMQETRVRSLGWEDPLEKEMAIHSRTIAWKIPWTEEPSRLQSMGSQSVGHDWATSLTHPQYSLSYPNVRVGLWRKLSDEELMLLNCGLEKTFESPLDCKEIQPVHSEGDQSWDFSGRNDA